MNNTKEDKIIKRYFEESNIRNIIFNCLIINVLIFTLDYFNIPSNIIDKDILYIDCFIFLHIIAGLLLIYFFFNNIRSCIESDDYNPLDTIILYGLILSIVNIFFSLSMNHKVCLNLEFIIIGITLLIARLVIINGEKKENKTNKTTETEHLLLLKDEPITNIEDDLLDITQAKESLVNYIKYYHSEKSFVLGLVGEWGSGKTSLIKLAEKEVENENIKIVNFDVWNLKDEESLFDGFYKLLLKTIGTNGNHLELRKNLNKYKKILFSYIKTNTSMPFDDLIPDFNSDIETIKKEINKVIKKYDKELVIVIDDLDRMPSEKILFIMKLLKNIIDFNGVKYILCYDTTKLNNILKDSYSINYVEKITNAQILVPEIDRVSFNVLLNSTINAIFKHYKIEIDILDKELSNLLLKISQDLNNMRSLIRFVNSMSLNINTLKKIDLYKTDFIGLEYLRVSNEKLYKYIYQNYMHFISKPSDSKTEKIILELKNALDATDNQIDIVKKIFWDSTQNVGEDIYNKRCRTLQFFYAYFGNKKNAFTSINEEIKIIIEEYNQGKKIEEHLSRMINDKYKSYSYKTMLKHNIDLLKDKKSFIDELLKFNDEFLDTIITILESLDEESQSNIVMKKLNKKISILNSLATWTNIDGETPAIVEKCKKELSDRINNIVKNKKDIYSDEIYEPGITFIFSQQLGYDFMEYMNENINEKNVLRLANSFVTINTSNKNILLFDRDMARRCIDKKVFDKYIDNIVQNKLNQSEKIVYRVYKEEEIELKENEIYDSTKVRYTDTSK